LLIVLHLFVEPRVSADQASRAHAASGVMWRRPEKAPAAAAGIGPVWQRGGFREAADALGRS